MIKNCLQCDKIIDSNNYKKPSLWKRVKLCSIDCRNKFNIKEDAGYRAIHYWIENNFGKADRCENLDCTYTNPKRYEWSNISGNYLRDREDWRRLCPSCHRKIDYTDEQRLKLSNICKQQWAEGQFANRLYE